MARGLQEIEMPNDKATISIDRRLYDCLEAYAKPHGVTADQVAAQLLYEHFYREMVQIGVKPPMQVRK